MRKLRLGEIMKFAQRPKKQIKPRVGAYQSDARVYIGNDPSCLVHQEWVTAACNVASILLMSKLRQ